MRDKTPGAPSRYFLKSINRHLTFKLCRSNVVVCCRVCGAKRLLAGVCKKSVAEVEGVVTL
jgi:hypothetical protein